MFVEPCISALAALALVMAAVIARIHGINLFISRYNKIYFAGTWLSLGMAIVFSFRPVGEQLDVSWPFFVFGLTATIQFCSHAYHKVQGRK